jgi:hypothetical protein
MTINSSTQYWRPPVVQMRQGVYGDEMGKSLGMPTTLVAGKNAITSSVTLRAKIK